MPAGTKAALKKSVTVLGRTYEQDADIYADVAPPFDVSVPAAKVGQLTTRGSNTAGTLTMSGGHGFTDAARLDIYWVDPTTGAQKCRYGTLVGTVATNSVPFSGGAGDNLPDNLTAVTAMVPVSETLVITGDNVQFMTAESRQGGTVAYCQADNTAIYAVVLDGDPTGWTWTNQDGSTNPLAGVTLGKVFLSHARSDQAVTLRGVIGYN